MDLVHLNSDLNSDDNDKPCIAVKCKVACLCLSMKACTNSEDECKWLTQGATHSKTCVRILKPHGDICKAMQHAIVVH